MDKSKEYSEWLKYADDDLESAEILNNQYRKPLNVIFTTVNKLQKNI